MFQCKQDKHYSFSKIGFVIVANEHAFLKVPISIAPIQKQINQAHALCSRLRKSAKELGDSSIGGLQINSLSYSCDGRYKILNSKFETSTYFYSREHKYDANVVFKRLKDRAISIDYIIPDFTLKHPRFSQSSTNSLPFMLTRKEMGSPDDEEPEEPAEDEGSGEADAEAESEPEDEINETVEAPDNADEAYKNHPSFKDLFQQGTVQDENDFESPFDQNFNNEVQNNSSLLKGALLKRSVPWETNSSHPHYFDIVNHEKSKRQVIMSLLAGIAASVGVSSLFGGARASQISNLNAEVQNLASKQNVIIAQLEHNSEAILVNRAMSEGLKDLTIKTARFVESEHFVTHGILLYTLISSEFDRIEDALQTHISIIESAQNNHFHPSILSYDGSVSAFERVKANAAKKGLVPVIQSPQQLSQMHTSFTYTKRGINLLVEIPLASPDSTFSLHQFHSMPISLSQNAYVQLKSNVPILGIGKADLTGKPLFIEMTHADLAQCNHFSEKVFLCTQQRKIKRPSSPSCVYSLYHKDHQAAEHTCLINLKSHSHDHAIATGPNEFMYFSNQSMTYYIVCQNHSTSSHQKLRGPSKIIVPSGCRIESNQFILYPQSDFEIPVEHELYSWSNPTLSLIANDSNVNTLEEAIAALDNIKGAPPLDPESFKRFQRLHQPFYQQYPVSFSSMIFAGVAFLLILWLISIWVYKNYKANRKLRRPKNPKYRSRKFFENVDNIDFLENLREKNAEPKSS